MIAGRDTKATSVDWNTPLKILDLIYQWRHTIGIDPCSNNTSVVKSNVWFTIKDDGLVQDWGKQGLIFVNPPYGRGIKDWFKKSYLTSLDGEEIIMLVPVATNTSHWKEYVFGKATVGFIKDSRLKFLVDGSDNNKGAPMACCLIYYGVMVRASENLLLNYAIIYKCELFICLDISQGLFVCVVLYCGY